MVKQTWKIPCVWRCNSLTSTRGLLTKTRTDNEFVQNWQSAFRFIFSFRITKIGLESWKLLLDKSACSMPNLETKALHFSALKRLMPKEGKRGSLNFSQTSEITCKARWQQDWQGHVNYGMSSLWLLISINTPALSTVVLIIAKEWRYVERLLLLLVTKNENKNI